VNLTLALLLLGSFVVLCVFVYDDIVEEGEFQVSRAAALEAVSPDGRAEAS